MKNSDQPIFPIDMETNKYHTETGVLPFGTGLTKREHFAGLAMQAIISGIYSSGGAYSSFKKTSAEENKTVLQLVSDQAILLADDLLKQLGE